MTRDPDRLLYAAIAFATAVFASVCLGGGCATAVDKARISIGTAATLAKSAGELLIEVDKDKQEAIADEAKKTNDASGAKEKLVSWRAARTKARAALQTLNAAIVVASVSVELASQGKSFDLAGALVPIAKAYVAVRDAFIAFGIELPKGFP